MRQETYLSYIIWIGESLMAKWRLMTSSTRARLAVNINRAVAAYWMDGWMDGWMDEWMEGWMQIRVLQLCEHLII